MTIGEQQLSVLFFLFFFFLNRNIRGTQSLLSNKVLEVVRPHNHVTCSGGQLCTTVTSVNGCTPFRAHLWRGRHCVVKAFSFHLHGPLRRHIPSTPQVSPVSPEQLLSATGHHKTSCQPASTLCLFSSQREEQVVVSLRCRPASGCPGLWLTCCSKQTDVVGCSIVPVAHVPLSAGGDSLSWVGVSWYGGLEVSVLDCCPGLVMVCFDGPEVRGTGPVLQLELCA